MATGAPRVSVITAACNGEKYLAEAIDSVLSQSYPDFEYILVDDASTDATREIIAQYAERDERICCIRNEINQNTAGALNRGLALSRGEYIAILDHDDLALPGRLAKQVAYLDAHPKIGVLGSQVLQIDANGQAVCSLIFPTEPMLARWQVFFHSPVLHSAAMMRKEFLAEAGGYSRLHATLCDWELFARLMEMTQAVNLAERLAAYRHNHPGQITSRQGREQLGGVLILMYALLAERLGLRVSLPELAWLFRSAKGKILRDEKELLRVVEIIDQIRSRFVEVEGLDEAGRDLVGQDCAWQCLKLATSHYASQRAAARQILQRARELDPQLLRRPQTWRQLRQWRVNQRGRWTTA